jgi:hypothetical protein
MNEQKKNDDQQLFSVSLEDKENMIAANKKQGFGPAFKKKLRFIVVWI